MAQVLQKISFFNALSLMSVAVFVDTTQFFSKALYFIPFFGGATAMIIGVMLSIVAIILFSLWMAVMGVPMLDRAPIMAATTVIEIMPIINVLPGWTTYILLTLFVVNRKAKYNEATNEVS